MSNARSDRLSRFAALPWHERRTVLFSIPTLIAAMIVVRSGGLRLALWLVRHAAAGRSGISTSGPRRLGVLTQAAADWLPLQSSCLERSIALSWMLVRRGHSCALVVEAESMAPSFQAHAWVDTMDGAIGRHTDVPAVEIARWNLLASPE